ncbi:YmfQ family protein [Paenibacillus sp. N1-5-1-14]|uniref:YmfQ family protein n=1 Tax=Paenibacillus radicibacter TaxID=2972488 RepID=UPI0021593961|nr:YmfQ family protein [Paenibacillus radicibacter]MCR8645592.1 YmfQ family protein [Paenibacillus radicibacter]
MSRELSSENHLESKRLEGENLSDNKLANIVLASERLRGTFNDRMRSALPSFVVDSPVMSGLTLSQADQLGQLREATDDTLNQFFIDSATWGLANWERFVGLPTDLTKPLDQRRSVVKSKIRGIGTVNVELIKGVAESFDNGEVVVDEDFTKCLIRVEFVGKYGIPPNIEDLKLALREIIPAHLHLDYKFKFTTHAELKGFTYRELAKYTHHQIREGL